jgi:hypothetical protein
MCGALLLTTACCAQQKEDACSQTDARHDSEVTPQAAVEPSAEAKLRKELLVVSFLGPPSQGK